jgi:fatty acid synthase subunit alpha
LSNARQQQSGVAPSPLLDINYRRSRMDEEVDRCRAVFEQDILARLDMGTRAKCPEISPPLTPPDQDISQRESFISNVDQHTRRVVKDIKYHWGSDFARNDPQISPLTAALATWNLTIDDVEVVSLHGTSTVGNDKNESSIIQQQFDYLGRAKGNPVLAVAQKSITGHPKGAAGAWMINGALQIMNTGVIPGNRNADNVDAALRQFSSIVYPNATLRNPNGMVKAVSVTSFGFGQKGGQAILVHPQYMLATLEASQYHNYAIKTKARQHRANAQWIEGLMNNTLVRVKAHPPYANSDERSVLMNPEARISWDDALESFRFEPSSLATTSVGFPQTTLFPIPESISRRGTNDASLTATEAGTSVVSRSTPATTPDDESHREVIKASDIQASVTSLLISRLTEGIENDRSIYNIGVDVEEAQQVPVDNDTFVLRNFTLTERKLAQQSADPASTLAGKWCAKEAVFKSLNLQSKGAAAAMHEVEIVPRPRNDGEDGSGSLPPTVIVSNSAG